MASVHLRYWAGAETAAGCREESVTAATIAGAIEAVRARRPGDREFERVLAVASYLRDGQRVHPETFGDELSDDVRVEVLPPFAGG